MKSEDRELRDDRLAAHLREALGKDRAPEAWVTEALSVPSRAGGVPGAQAPVRSRAAHPAGLRPSIAREPWLVAFFPHLAGLVLLGGLALAWCLRPELVRGALDPAVRFLDQTAAAGYPGFWTLAGILVPFVVLFIEQGARGFPILRRLGFRH